MSVIDTIEDTRSPAEIYDEQFVPALFRQWAGVVTDAAGLGTGQRVLDVACGTGVLACAAADRVGASGSAVGLDLNPQMLAVARRKRTDIEWLEGPAESLPLPDSSIDAVVSQFGMMFFEDPVAALREMMRVLRPGGAMAVAVCDAVENSPGYSTLAELLQRLFGKKVSDAFRAPFALGDPRRLRSLCEQAGIANAAVGQRQGLVRFDSIEALVCAERACVWTLGGMLDDAQFERLLDASQTALRPFAAANGQVEFEMPALLITARKA